MSITKINIGGKTVSVDTSIADRLLAANDAKMSATGKPIRITDSFRSGAKQAELYRRSQAGEIGRAAPPGMSFHETGKAVDVADFGESEQFLRRYGLVNDLGDDKGHFSIGETQPEKYTSFASSTEKGRQRGFTDTQLIDLFVKKNKEMGQTVEKSRARYGTDKRIKNDRDLVNFLALRYSGVSKLETPSVAEKEEEPGFIGRTVERFKESGKEITEASEQFKAGDINILEEKLIRTGSQINLIAETGFDAFFGGLKTLGKFASAITPDIIEDPIKRKASELGNALIKSDEGKLLISAAEKGEDIYTKFSEEHPRLATDIEAILRIAEVIPVKKGATVTTKLGREIAETAITKTRKVAGPVITKTKEAIKPTAIATTGLSEETIEGIIKNPKLFTKKALQEIDVASDIKGLGNIDDKIRTFSFDGGAYDAVRMIDDLDPLAKVNLEPKFLDNILKEKHGLDISDGTVIATSKTVAPKVSDIEAIEEVVKKWIGKDKLKPSEFLEFRDDVIKLAEIEGTSKSVLSRNVGIILETELNKLRKQIPGLERIDNSFIPLKEGLKTLKKKAFKPNGDLDVDELKKFINSKEGKSILAEDTILKEQLNTLISMEKVKGVNNFNIEDILKNNLNWGTVMGSYVIGNPLPAIASIAFGQRTPLMIPALRGYGKFKKLPQSKISKMADKIKNGMSLNKGETKIMDDIFKDKAFLLTLPTIIPELVPEEEE